LQNDLLLCNIDDNGLGWRKKNSDFSYIKYESTALNIIKERLNLIKSYNNHNGCIEIIDKGTHGYREAGTIVKNCLYPS